MATLPRASTVLQDTAGVPAGGLDVICVFAPVSVSPDITPRFFGNAADIYAQHGYSEGLEYAALHFTQTRKPVLFVGLPIVTQGVLSRLNTEGNAGTSVVSVTAAAGGCLAEHHGMIEVIAGGTVGVNQIVLGLSLDGGRTWQKLRVGTNNSIAIPYIGVTISLGAGTLVADPVAVVLSWRGSGPLSDQTSREAARVALSGQQKAFRSILMIGDCQAAIDASNFLTTLNTYETSNERFIYGRCGVSDLHPRAQSSSVRKIMSGAPSLTFTSTTATRASGSFLTDGFAVGDMVYLTGTASNNGTKGPITALTATVLTVASGFTVETTATAVVTGRQALTFAAAGNTVTRSSGSWISDGFAVGQVVTFAGTASNNFTATITALTATVMSFSSGVANETVGIGIGSAVQSLTKAAWMAAQDLVYSVVDAAPRIDISAGRARITSPFSQWYFRRPASWFASLREYAHDLHVATWRKQDGPLAGADLADENGNLYEWDDRVDGAAASAARFTSLRTWGNGPQGAFVALSLTRANEGSLQAYTHNKAVVNLAQTVCQLNTENACVGVSLTLNDDGTATKDALATIQSRVNAALELALLVNAQGEGARASKAVWTPSANDILNVPNATLTGVLDLQLNGTIVNVTTTVRIRSGGQ